MAALFEAIEAVKAWLLSTGQVLPAGATSALQERVDRLEAAAHLPAPAPSEGESARPAPTTNLSADPSAAPPKAAGVAAPEAAAPASRGFRVPNVQAADAARSGSLGDRSLQDAMLDLAVQRTTGLLVLHCADGRKRVGFWNKGGPVGFRTDPVQEAEVLGVLLFKAGQVDKAQLAESLERMKRTGQRQGEAFIEMGLMTFSQLIMVLGKQTEFVLQRVLAETAGTWEFHDLDSLPEQFLPPPVRVPSLLYRSLVAKARSLPAEQLAAAYRKNIDQYIHFNEKVSSILADVQFDAAERKILEIMHSNTWRMREVFSMSPISRQGTAAVLWAMVELQFLEFDRDEDAERYLRRVSEMVDRKRRQLRKCTHFEVLDVHWISLPEEIEAGYQRLREETDPSNYTGLSQELVDGLMTIRARMDESHALLMNDARRREYRKTFLEPMMISQSAELLAKKGEMAIMRKDRREGSLCFAKALELEPNNAEYREGLQRARTVV